MKKRPNHKPSQPPPKRNIILERKLSERRSVTRIENFNHRNYAEKPRLGVAADRAPTGYRHNGTFYHGGYHL